MLFISFNRNKSVWMVSKSLIETSPLPFFLWLNYQEQALSLIKFIWLENWILLLYGQSCWQFSLRDQFDSSISTAPVVVSRGWLWHCGNCQNPIIWKGGLYALESWPDNKGAKIKTFHVSSTITTNSNEDGLGMLSLT